MIYVGTSGFSYKEWKGSLYPEDLSPKKFLSFYSTIFNTTEINNSFYRIPSLTLTTGWAGQVGDDFRFTLKMNQRITHRKKLEDVDEEMGWFLKGAEGLGVALGTVLVQLPPWLRLKPEVLANYVGRFADAVPMAFEFRHESWFCDETRQILEENGATLAAVETDEREALRSEGGPFTYIRLRKSAYESKELEAWAEWARGLNHDVYVYFKHEAEAPQLARTFQELVG